MKTDIIVTIDTRDGDTDRCGRDCPYDEAYEEEFGMPPSIRWCHACQDITENGLRCPACLDGEMKAKGGRK